MFLVILHFLLRNYDIHMHFNLVTFEDESNYNIKSNGKMMNSKVIRVRLLGKGIWK